MRTPSLSIKQFRELVYRHYRADGRGLPWRDKSASPYQIFVSECMLQQTQAQRVVPKYESFLAEFPSFEALAEAPFQLVLEQWSGLGYNRRAKFIQQAAQKVMQDFAGELPRTIDELVQLPGIGPNTAGATIAYAFNKPVIYIETNIRSVLLHHYCELTGASSNENVADKELLELAGKVLDVENPREWYWALMDYGVHLKATNPNPSRASKHHTTQSKFEGSLRQVRGKVLKALIAKPLTRAQLQMVCAKNGKPELRLDQVLASLVFEQMIEHNATSDTFSIRS